LVRIAGAIGVLVAELWLPPPKSKTGRGRPKTKRAS
jgi:hypothetical protein